MKDSTARVIVIGVIVLVFVWIGIVIYSQYQDLNDIESYIVHRECFVMDGVQLSLDPPRTYSMNRLEFGHTSLEYGEWSAADPYRFGRRIHFTLNLTAQSFAGTKEDIERSLDVVFARDGGGRYLEIEGEKWYESTCVRPELNA